MCICVWVHVSMSASGVLIGINMIQKYHKGLMSLSSVTDRNFDHTRTIWRSCYTPETHPQKHITQLNNYLSHMQICGSPMASNIHENHQHWEHTNKCTSKLKIVRTLTPKTSIKEQNGMFCIPNSMWDTAARDEVQRATWTETLMGSQH